jgi:hypothetical protein
VARSYGRHWAVLFLPHSEKSNACGQDKRLGIFGQREKIRRPLLCHMPQVQTQLVGCFGKGSLYDGVQFARLRQHSDGLRTLTREYKRE